MVLVVWIAIALGAGVLAFSMLSSRHPASLAIRGLAGRLRLPPALLVGVVAALAFAAILVMVLTGEGLSEFDLGAARWAADHAGHASTEALRALTWLGATVVVVPVAAAAAIWSVWRLRRWEPAVLVVVVVVGQNLFSNSLKVIVDRVRPDIDPLAGFVGPSYPSGHTTAAAACWAVVAAVLAIGQSHRVRMILAGAAVTIAVLVGASRVLLGVHWLTDVVAGLVLGWGWFGVCALATHFRPLWDDPAPAEREQAEIRHHH